MESALHAALAVSQAHFKYSEAWISASSALMPARTEKSGAWPASQVPKGVSVVLWILPEGEVSSSAGGGSGTTLIMVKFL
ncbi:hypothetical protein D3C87_2027990 [compost metagenome]